MDEPLTLSLPLVSSNSAVVPPPIPPNPEKDALLRQLGSTLYALRQQARQQNETWLAHLASQRAAMQAAQRDLQADAAALAPLSALLANNAQILQGSLREAAERVVMIESLTKNNNHANTANDNNNNNNNSKNGPGKAKVLAPLAIDDLLVAPTVVGNQLYDVVAEERALGDAIFVLGRAVERGRLAPAVFARTTRSLAREWYLKKALVRKIGRGMGLVG